MEYNQQPPQRHQKQKAPIPTIAADEMVQIKWNHTVYWHLHKSVQVAVSLWRTRWQYDNALHEVLTSLCLQASSKWIFSPIETEWSIETEPFWMITFCLPWGSGIPINNIEIFENEIMYRENIFFSSNKNEAGKEIHTLTACGIHNEKQECKTYTQGQE